MERMDENRERDGGEVDMGKDGRVKARSMEQGPIGMGQGSLCIR